MIIIINIRRLDNYFLFQSLFNGFPHTSLITYLVFIDLYPRAPYMMANHKLIYVIIYLQIRYSAVNLLTTS